jgi:membrane-associated protease RseP (regulator of RpoE activity)
LLAVIIASSTIYGHGADNGTYHLTVTALGDQHGNIRVGDVITSVDREPIKIPTIVNIIAAQHKMTLHLRRGDTEFDVTVPDKRGDMGFDKFTTEEQTSPIPAWTAVRLGANVTRSVVTGSFVDIARMTHLYRPAAAGKEPATVSQPSPDSGTAQAPIKNHNKKSAAKPKQKSAEAPAKSDSSGATKAEPAPSLLDLHGIIGMVATSSSLLSGGLVTGMLTFMFYVSIGVGVMNSLPVPMLDGGQLVFLAIEKVRGRPLGPTGQTILVYSGFGLVGSIIAWTTINDLIGLWTNGHHWLVIAFVVLPVSLLVPRIYRFFVAVNRTYRELIARNTTSNVQ